MKKLASLSLSLFLSTIFIWYLTSCGKNEITPGNYTITPEAIDTSNWQYQYTYAGVLPNWGNNQLSNELVGTRWVLTFLQIGFSFPPLPIDTVDFISNQYYTINGGAVKTYQLTSNVGISSKTLILNYHYPFGSGNYAAQVASTFVEDGVISLAQFVNTNTPTYTIIATFTRIQ